MATTTKSFSNSLHSIALNAGTTAESIGALAFGAVVVGETPVTIPPSQGFPISIAGRNYMADTSFEPYRREAFRHKSIPPQRASLHFTNIPDDGTVSTEGLWRREARSWNLGSGQVYFDRASSSNYRFAHSRGINPWNEWHLSLLHDTQMVYPAGVSSVTGYLKAIRCGEYVYLWDDTTSSLYYFNSNQGGNEASWPTNFATLPKATGISGTFLNMCSNGYQVYVITTKGVYYMARGTGSGAGDVTQLVVSGNASGTGTSYPWSAAVTPNKDNDMPGLQAVMEYVGDRLIVAFTNLQQWSPGTYKINSIVTPNNYTGTVKFNLSGTNPFQVGQQITLANQSMTGLSTANKKYVVSAVTDTSFSISVPDTGVYVTNTTTNSTASQTLSPSSNVTLTLASTTGFTAGGGTATYSQNYVLYKITYASVSGSTITGVKTASGTVTTAANDYVTPLGGDITASLASLKQYSTVNGGAAVFDLSDHVAGQPLAYNAPEFLYVHPDPAWKWTGIASASSNIYMCGYSNDDPASMSAVYRTGINSTSPTTSTLPTLTYPTVALPLPHGEWATAMIGYLNYIFLGTSKGIRMCQANTSITASVSGELNSGPIVPDQSEHLKHPVTGIVGNDRFVYFTWNYFYDYYNDTEVSGIGRLDLTNFVDTLAPAYASDLMIPYKGRITELDWDPIHNGPLMCANRGSVTATGNLSLNRVNHVHVNKNKWQQHVLLNVTGTGFTFSKGEHVLVTYGSNTLECSVKRVRSTLLELFVINPSPIWLTPTKASPASVSIAGTGNAVFTIDPKNRVQSGWIDSGLITFGIPDNKNAVRIDVNIDNFGLEQTSSVTPVLYVDGQQTGINVGTYSGTSNKYTFDNFGQVFGEQYNIYTTFNAGKTNGYYVSPEFNRITLKALPGIPSGIMISCVVLLYEPFEVDGQTIYLDPYAEYDYLESLRQSQTVVDYVEGPFTAKVTVDLLDWLPERRRNVTQGGYHGDLVVYLKTLSG